MGLQPESAEYWGTGPGWLSRSDIQRSGGVPRTSWVQRTLSWFGPLTADEIEFIAAFDGIVAFRADLLGLVATGKVRIIATPKGEIFCLV